MPRRIALFSRVGGGIYTKAADIGADLVGKVEAGIPEDDPRNPAVIADNVGDNVGDVAGMGADLFESYVGALVAPIAYAGFAFAGADFLPELLVFPLLIAAVGMGGSIVGALLVRPRGHSPAPALHVGTWVAMGITVVGVAALTPVLFAETRRDRQRPLGLFLAVLVGLVVGYLIGWISEVFTSDHYRIVKEVARQAQTGPATVVLSGISEGMRSAAFSVVVTALGILGAFAAGEMAMEGGGVYGIAIAAIGVLATLGMTVSVDAYGPIADNAGGIAEMAGLPGEVRQVTDALDALGNTTAAVAKGFAIGSAAVTSLALFFAFRQAVGAENLPVIDLLDAPTTVGLVLGAMFPYLFAAMAIQAVGRAANQMIDEVRRQFREIPGLLDGDPAARPDYSRAIDISTKAALREMFLPGLLADRPAAGGRVHLGACPRRPARRGTGQRVPARHLHGQRRWRLGQRQEVHRGRCVRRQGLRGAQGGGGGRHHRRPLQGHGRPGDEHRHQGDDHRQPDLRLGLRVSEV